MKRTITRRCDNCRVPLEWDWEHLEYHQERLKRGEHAACACDDACAAIVAPWRPARLRRAINQAIEAAAEAAADPAA